MRLSLITGVVLLFAWIAGHIIADTTAQRLAATDPAEALRWSPNNSRALDQLAQLELRKKDGDFNAAKEWARRSLKSNPLDDQALFLLGTAAEKMDDTNRAERLIRAAGTRSWRNLAVQFWLFQHDVTRKDYSAGLAHADAMLRVEPKLLAPLFPTLAAFTTDPQALVALAKFLEKDTPWRRGFLAALSSDLYDKSHLDRIYSILADSKNPPQKQELQAYLERLIKDGRFELAHQKWHEALPRAQADSAIPYNGKFEFPVDGLPFNWNIHTIDGADVRIVSPADSKGRALRVQFSGARVTFENVKQLLLLRPGRYRLSGQVKADDLRTTRGLWWRIFCAAESKSTLAQSELVSGSHPWTAFLVDFEVPGQGCSAQSLRLELPARTGSERRIEGQVWYQGIRIEPVLPDGRAPGPNGGK